MELDLKFCRFESAPWGFRLVGGADFELPLTVVKIAEGGLAEQAGMRIGDTVLRINDESTEEMSHTDVHKIITECGNNFFLTVYREENQEGDYIEETDMQDTFDTQEICQTNSHQIEENTEEMVNITSNDVEVQKITGEEEAEKILEKEVETASQEAISQVTCKKSGICVSSEVFQTIKEESWKSMMGKDNDKRKWTTFLQKPNRPIPKNKFDPEVISEPYKVQIIKQPKPRVAPDRIPTPPPELPELPPTVEESKENGETPLFDSVPEENEEESLEPPTDSEVPNLEPTETISSNGEVQQSEINDTEAGCETENQDSSVVEQLPEPEVIEEPKKTEEELLFEKQLSDIQKQLMALSSLPSTIQATLDAVTRQLSGLLPNVKLELPVVSNSLGTDESYIQDQSAEREGTVEKEISYHNEDVVETYQNSCQENTFEREASYEGSEEIVISKNQMIEEQQSESREQNHRQIIVETTSQEERYEEEEEFMQEEHSSKSQKDLVLLELEHRQRLIKERSSKRPPRAFGPLTPQERPLVLPGGRKWRKPKDAFNDEFIADILSSQAELIIGHTLGVNFLKYKKPEKHIDLEKSEVYKVIHSLDNAPRRGIEVRPERVMAEADVLTNSTPVS